MYTAPDPTNLQSSRVENRRDHATLHLKDSKYLLCLAWRENMSTTRLNATVFSHAHDYHPLVTIGSGLSPTAILLLLGPNPTRPHLSADFSWALKVSLFSVGFYQLDKDGAVSHHLEGSLHARRVWLDFTFQLSDSLEVRSYNFV